MLLAAVPLEPLARADYEYMLSCLDVERQRTIKAYRREADACRSLLGEALARVLLSESLGVNWQHLHWRRSEFGKPYVANARQGFNISHSGRWVVGAAAAHDIGVDVEQVRPVDLAIAEQFFCRREVADLHGRTVEERPTYFFQLWTLKESYLKAEGSGLNKALDRVAFQIGHGKHVRVAGTAADGWEFKLYDQLPGHQVAVCAAGGSWPREITLWPCRELFRRLARAA